LNTAAIQLENDRAPSRVGGVRSHHQSKLLPSLFRLVDVNHRMTVLEIGQALPETVEFFSRFKCRLHFLDLYHEPFVREQQADLSEQELQHAFEERLRFEPGTRIDICLFWDFLGYLDDAALRAFNAALRPWLYYGTKAHGFGVHHLAIRLENIQYGILDPETLTIRERQSAQLPFHPHSQVEMQEIFSCFGFERGLLLPDGKLEMLLKSRA
jgi:hypothetical protein